MIALVRSLFKKQKTFYWQVASQYIALSIGISVVYFLTLVFLAWSYLDVAKQRLHWETAEYLAHDLAHLIEHAGVDAELLKRNFYIFSLLNPGVEPYLLDKNGTVLVSQYDNVRRVDLEPITEFLSRSAPPFFAVMGENPRKDQRPEEIFSVAKVSLDDGQAGYLYLILRGEEWYAIYGMLGNYFSIVLGIFALLFCLFLGSVLGLRIVSRTSKRFQHMTSVMKRFADRDFGVRINDSEEDELGEHAQTFDAMADIISANIEQLERAEEIRSEMMSLLTHDLRTPITVMRTSLESQLLEYDRMSDLERKELLHQSLSKCLSLNRLLSQMFELNSIEHHSRALQYQPFSFNDLVADITQEVTTVAQYHKVELEVLVEDTEGMVLGDIALLERVIRNLIENAIRYSYPNTSVRIRCENNDDAVCFEVKDSGCGISSEDMPYVFDPFFRSSTAKKHVRDGTGLGLSICKRILDAHSVPLQLRSVLAEGTVVRFCIPYA